MNLPPMKSRRVGFANQFPVGLALYTVRSFERPVISHSVLPKIDKRAYEVKNKATCDVHISFTQDINILLISEMFRFISPDLPFLVYPMSAGFPWRWSLS